MREGKTDITTVDIPENWELIPLYELRNKTDRYSFTGGPFGSDLKSEHYTSGGVKVIQLQDIGEGQFLNKSQIYVTEEKANDLISCNIYPNDIILAKMAPVARCCKIPSSAERFVMCSDGIRLAVDTKRFDNEFIFQALNSKQFRDTAESQSTGTTRARIGLSDLKGIPIPVPKDIKEQKKIAEILSTVDDKIEVIGEQIEQTQELKKSLMQRLLTKGIGHTQFKDSPLGQIPESWEVVRVNEVVEINPAKPKELLDSDMVSFVGMADTSEDAKLMNHHPKQFSEVSKGFTSFKDGDVLVAKITPCFENGKGALVTDLVNGFGFGSTEFHVLRAKENILNRLIYYHTVSYSFRETGKSNMTGSAGQKRVGKDFIASYQIALPPLHEQEKIVNILTTVDDKLEILQDKKAQYQELKKGLMQQLLTGKLRVKHLIEQTELA